MLRIWLLVVAIVVGATSMSHAVYTETDVETLSREFDEALGLKRRIVSAGQPHGAYVAHPENGWVNPGALPASKLRGFETAGSYEQINAGKVRSHAGNVRVKGQYRRVAAQVEARGGAAYATANQHSDDEQVIGTLELRPSLAVDLSGIGLKGFSLGAATSIPIRQGEYYKGNREARRLDAELHVQQKHEVSIGLHWRGGEDDWFMTGAMATDAQSVVSGSSVHLTKRLVEGEGGEEFTVIDVKTTNDSVNARERTARAGVSVEPLVPLVANGSERSQAIRQAVRISTDTSYEEAKLSNRKKDSEVVQHITLDLLLPDVWNPIASIAKPAVGGSINTKGEKFVVAGIHSGPFQCQGTYGATNSMDGKAALWGATCGVGFRF